MSKAITPKQAKALGIKTGSALEEYFETTYIRGWIAFDFIRQYKALPDRKFKLDFAWPELKCGKVAVEIQGGLWMKGGGGHSHPMHIIKDQERMNALVCAGWRILQYHDKESMKRFPEDFKKLLEIK